MRFRRVGRAGRARFSRGRRGFGSRRVRRFSRRRAPARSLRRGIRIGHRM